MGRALQTLLIGVPMLLSAVTGTVAAPPSPAPAADAVLYEVTENMVLDDLATPTLRTASAALMGTAALGSPLCPESLVALLQGLGLVTGTVAGCSITAYGEDAIDLGTGAGTLSGKAAIVVNSDNPNDGPEHVAMEADFAAGMQILFGGGGALPLIAIQTGTLTPTAILGVPIAGVAVLGLNPAVFGPSSFGGVFRLPFSMQGDIRQHAVFGRPAFYLTDAGTTVTVKPMEYSLTYPTVRVEIHFLPPAP
jgi:hypothetical protein